MLEEALAMMEAGGHRAAAVRVERLDELREHYEDLFRRGLLETGLAQDAMAGLTLRPPGTVAHPASLIVVATRDPVVICTFEWRGKNVPIPVPPTYLHYKRKNTEVMRELAELLPERCSLARLPNAPQKLLSVRSGMARYGRNNISYIEGFGSFHRLTTLCTDIPCENDRWSAPSMMPRCEGCTVCASACPSGAIPDDRFLLRGERCITFWNEKAGDIPFPEWLDGGWHDSLVGCMHCQLACPENEAVLGYREAGPRFTEEETDELLRSVGPDDLPRGLKEKLEKWDLMIWLGVLPRNLEAILPGPERREAL